MVSLPILFKNKIARVQMAIGTMTQRLIENAPFVHERALCLGLIVYIRRRLSYYGNNPGSNMTGDYNYTISNIYMMFI